MEHLAARVPFDADPQVYPDEGAIAAPPLQLDVLDPLAAFDGREESGPIRGIGV